MSNNIGNNMNPNQNIGSAMTVAATTPGSMLSVSGHQQNIATPMEVDSGIPPSVMAPQPSLPNLTASSSPGLGNLQSVMGTGTTNIVSSSAVTPSASQHSSLASALQGGGSNTNTTHNNMTGTGTSSMGSSVQSSLGSQMKTSSSTASSVSHDVPSVILTRPRLQDLVREVDPTEQLDEEVEELLLQLADDFVESTVSAACLLAKHRNASTVEVKDVQLHLERQWNMWLPGFGTDELRPYKRAPVTEAHKQRLALIRKSLKKY
ncbi:Transcription initiation factor TFIID subunit 12 [Gryllus bimaculatus]|nr:Transcription initiation factor TFIID subunit 12 [Gryllus bimaculatus]